MKLTSVRTMSCATLGALLLLVAAGPVRADAFAGEKAATVVGREHRDPLSARSDTPPAGADGLQNGGVSGVPRDGRKYHPGHYIDLLRYQVFSDDARYLIPSLKPGVVGVQTRYLWSDLETEPGHYDFSRVQADLNLLADRKKQLIVLIEDKSFKPVQPVPSYLAARTLPNRQGGFTAERWDPYIIERWVKLMQALGRRFDSNPNFEGVATAESAPSLDASELKRAGYTPEKYRDALIEMLQRTAEAMPRSRVFWYMNFLPQSQHYIGRIVGAVESYGVALGGPDILPDNPAIKRRAYPFYHQFRGRVPLFCVAMPNSYRHRHKGESSTKYWTMEELYEFARDHLHLDYMLWTYVPTPKPSDAYDIYDAFPVIKRNPVISDTSPVPQIADWIARDRRAAVGGNRGQEPVSAEGGAVPPELRSQSKVTK